MTFEPEQGVLAVGGRTTLLDPRPPVGTVVGSYVELVVSQRAVTPTSHVDLRDRELAELADLLHLPPAELDDMIDDALDHLLGRIDDADDAAPTQRRYRSAVAAAALALLAAAVGVGVAASSPSGATQPTQPEPVVETVRQPDGSTVTRTESAPAPPADGVDIGTAVMYEREG